MGKRTPDSKGSHSVWTRSLDVTYVERVVQSSRIQCRPSDHRVFTTTPVWARRYSAEERGSRRVERSTGSAP